MDVSWTSGGGDERIVLVKAGSSVDSDPADSTVYTASTTFGSGDEIGTGNYVTYRGTGNSFTLTGLSGSTTYYVKVFEYVGGSSDAIYQTADTTNNPNSETTLKGAPTSQAYDIIATNKDGNTAKISWSGGNGEYCYVYMNTNNSFTEPSDGTDPTADNSFNNSGQQLLYKGSADNFVVSGLSENSTYYVRAYECNNTGTNTVFLNTSVSDNPTAFLSPYKEPTAQVSDISFSLNTTKINYTLTVGNGTGRLVKINTSNSFTDPVDGATYSANSTYGGGEQVIYVGSGSSAEVDGLSSNTTYYFKAFEYSNDNDDTDYKIDGHVADHNPNSAKTIKPEPTSQSSDIVFSNNSKISYTVGWTRPSSGGGDYVIVLGKEGAAVSDFPVDGATYTADNSFGNGSKIGADNYVLYIGTGNSVDVTNLKEGTNYSVRIFEYNNTGTYTDYLTSSASNNPRSGITQGDAQWQGDDATSPTNWGVAENWSTNEVPNSSRSVVIPASASSMPVISSGTQEVDDLTIEAGASLTINNGTTLNVGGDAILESPSSGAGMPGTLIIPGTGSFNADSKSTIERYIPTSNSHFYSSAISSVSVSDMMYYYVGTYSESNKSWTYLQPGDAMSPLKGYELLKSSNSSIKDKLSFTGTFNNGDKSISVANSSVGDDSYGWNLVGNPYPSSIDWEASGWTRTNVDATVYIYNASSQTYSSYTLNDDNHFYIAPMQGFFIHASSSTGTLGFSNAVRTSASADYKSSGTNKKQRITINVKNKEFETNASISFYDDATEQFDPKYDAYKLLGYNNSIPEIYTIINDSTYVERNTIQGNALDTMPSTGYDFRLGIKQGSSTTLTISLSELNNIPDSIDVFLIDSLEEKTVNLRDDFYTFSSNKLDDKRFTLHLEAHKVLVSDIIISSENDQNTVYVNDTLRLNTSILPLNASNNSVLWSIADNNIADINQYGEVVGKSLGNTTVYATATDGSGVSSSFNIDVQNTTTIKDAENNKIVFYPNPTSGTVIIKTSLMECNYKIYDNVGRVIKSGKFEYNETINLSNVDNGIYFVEFIYNNEKQTKLLIKN
jgi:hypothetical protein